MTTTEPTSFDHVLASVSDVEGWMTDGQARMLWDRASELRLGDRVVEIGSFRGRSLIVLARAAAEGVELIAIDPHAGNDRGPQEIEGFAEAAAEDNVVFWANLERAGVADRVQHLRKFSDDALADVNGQIELLYIDGAHRYAPALADIRSWGAKVAPGGTLLIHDSFSAVGVTLALLRQLFFSRDFRYVARAGSMTYYRREQLTGGQRVRSALRQAAQLPWFVRNLTIKTLIVARLGQLTRVFGHDPNVWPH
jgi:predicted O-methyltransferase YrrM